MTAGIKASAFDSAFPFKDGEDLIEEAALHTIVAKPLLADSSMLDYLRNRSPQAFEYSLSVLVPPSPSDEDANSILVALDPMEWFPDPSLNDESVPVSWSACGLLLLCRAGSTAIRNLSSGEVLRNKKGKPFISRNVRRLRKLGAARAGFLSSDVSTFRITR